MSSHLFQKTLHGPDETEDIARRIGKVLSPSDTVLLSGEIGAGKTHFARALIQSLQEVPEDVPSPTFTLVQTYDTKSGEIFHADLYRMSTPDDVIELGLLEAFETAICIVEWPDRLGSLAPETALSLTFEPTKNSDARVLTVFGPRSIWADRLKDIEHAAA